MKTAAARRERFLPHRYARAAIDLRLVRCEIDGKNVSLETSADTHTMDLDMAWKTARIRLELRVASTTVARLLPPGGMHTDVDLLVVVHCTDTFQRTGTRIPLRVDEPVLSELVLDRDDYAGVIELQAFLVRTHGMARQAGFAFLDGARVSDSRVFSIRLERVREVRGEHLSILYKRFSEDETIPEHDRRNVYRLELEQNPPILLINSDHGRLAGVLDSKGSVGRQARLREAIYDQIAHSVWTQLFLRAASRYVEAAENVYPWEEAVLELLLKYCYPGEKSPATRRDRLTDDWQDIRVVLQRLDSALQRRNDLSEHLARLIEEEEGR